MKKNVHILGCSYFWGAETKCGNLGKSKTIYLNSMDKTGVHIHVLYFLASSSKKNLGVIWCLLFAFSLSPFA